MPEPDADITELQRSLLDYITNDAEPTWIMLAELPEAGGDRDTTERALHDLEHRGLVRHERKTSGNPAGLEQLDDWWALTDDGWRLLGLRKPPRYP